MSDTRKKHGIAPRRWIVRSVLVIVYIGIMVLAYVGGKGHTILIDNKNTQDGSLTAFDLVTVQVDNQESSDYTKGDRDMAKVQGQRHRISVKVEGQENTIVKEITLPIKTDMIVVNIPKLVAGQDPLETFVPPKAVTPDREEQTFTSAGQGEATNPQEQIPNASSTDVNTPKP
jgi:hypothetical protein